MNHLRTWHYVLRENVNEWRTRGWREAIPQPEERNIYFVLMLMIKEPKQ